MRQTKFVQGWNDPEGAPKSRGWHGMEIHFILQRNDDLAIVARIHTGWEPYPRNEWGALDLPGVDQSKTSSSMWPNSQGIYLHSSKKLDDYWYGPEECDILPGGICNGTSGGLVGNDFLRKLVREGEEAAWSYLEELIDAWTRRKDLRA